MPEVRERSQESKAIVDMNGQSSLLDSQVQDRKGFVVSVERTIRLAEYESLRLTLSESFPGSVDRDQAYQSVLAKVQEWTSAAKPAAKTNEPQSSSSPVSKLASLQEQLGARLQDLELNDGLDSIIVKPRRYLGDAWKDVNDVVRALGGRWAKGNYPKDGSWRIPK